VKEKVKEKVKENKPILALPNAKHKPLLQAK
jgi:hypothetical protein